jgi:polyhydroxyalkanoate synthesis regulator phasin
MLDAEEIKEVEKKITMGVNGLFVMNEKKFKELESRIAALERQVAAKPT